MPRKEELIIDDWEFSLNDRDHFTKIDLPHDWAIDRPFKRDMPEGEAQGFRDRRGIGWYRKVYHLNEKKPAGRYYLDFGGIYENSTVWINGIEAGGRKYGYSPFQLDITGSVRRGDNEILIKVDNTSGPADRWYSGAGIYRTVKWIETEAKHFHKNDVVVRTRLDGSDALVTVRTGVDDLVQAVLTDGRHQFTGRSHDGSIAISVPHARLWSADNPQLYRLTLNLIDGDREADQIQLHVGIREIKMIADRGMFVNGRRVILKGVCLHQDVGCRGNAGKKELWRQRLADLKNMGCNAIRCAHHPYPAEFLDLCDEMGFYVYAECFDKWTGGSYGRYFHTEWKNDLSALIKTNRNRPCIFIWGMGNEVENQAQDSMLAILNMLSDYTRILDPSRPITYAMNPHFKRKSTIDVSQVKDIQKFVDEADETEITELDEKMRCIRKIADLVDVISCNYQEQWYEAIHKAVPDKVILGTEIYQFFQGHPQQLQNFSCQVPALVPLRLDYVIGGLIWTGIDYLGESMGYPAKGWSGSPLRTNGDRRFSYYLLQSYWTEKPMVHFSVLDYSIADEGVKEHWDLPPLVDHWHFPQFRRVVIPYAIASNCEEVRLFLNDKQIFVPRPDQFPNRLIFGFLPYQPGTVKAVGYRAGRAVCSQVVRTPGPAAKMVFDRLPERLDVRKGDELLLTVRATDRADNPVFRESAAVRFHVDGPGKLLAVDNGNLSSNEPYADHSIHLYRGQASVLIQFAGTDGRVVVSAAADGLQSGRAVICALSSGQQSLPHAAERERI
ncbi:MAG: DUF4982 domain-containing protein [Sporolactobacillus sp.]|nr:DUF4982 domain-containing protein [Sporolactobacillus sp.]